MRRCQAVSQRKRQTVEWVRELVCPFASYDIHSSQQVKEMGFFNEAFLLLDANDHQNCSPGAGILWFKPKQSMNLMHFQQGQSDSTVTVKQDSM